MKTTKQTLFLCLSAILLISCKSDDDSTTNDQENVSEFKGTWAGSFSGDDSGTWEVIINDSGTINGSFISNSVGTPIPLEGQVQENGDFLASSGSTQVGSTFMGELIVGEEQATAGGTWSFSNNGQDFSGDWIGTRTQL